MNWAEILQLIVNILTGVVPLITAVGSLHTAINGTPGTAEHTAAIAQLKPGATT